MTRDDAVTFGYGAVAHSDTDFHRAGLAPSRAHGPRFREDDTWGVIPLAKGIHYGLPLSRERHAGGNATVDFHV